MGISNFFIWNLINKKFNCVGAQFVKRFSNLINDYEEKFLQVREIAINNQDKKSLQLKKNAICNQDIKSKCLKIAILGVPNAGKSTLINYLIERPVCAASSKVHTTRKSASAIFCTNDTQLVFLDTPGLVSNYNLKKFKLENSFKSDAQKSVKEADFIGIIQDISRQSSRISINKEIIDLLRDNVDTKSILILNKIDTLKNKKLLLDIVNKLTHESNWSHFSDIFMVSALTGDGIADLRNYFLDSAKYNFWDYNKNVYTDQPVEVLINQTLKAILLDNLPQEIPYLTDAVIDNIEFKEDNSMNIVANINSSTRIARLIIGHHGERIKKIANDCEQILCKIFQTTVNLKIIVPIKEFNLKKKIGISNM